LSELRRRLAGAGIEVRRGDGLEPIRPGEVDCAVLAGMGGRTMIAELERGAPLARSLRCLVLQPMQRLDELTAWLAANGYPVADRRVVEDRGRSYTALKCLPPYSADAADRGSAPLPAPR
jgi:tRNA (adenine22-N1)-methyltransferase